MKIELSPSIGPETKLDLLAHLLTCIGLHRIMGLELGYGLGRCYASKIVWLVGWPSLCVARLCLNIGVIKRVIILKLNINHALKKITHTC